MQNPKSVNFSSDMQATCGWPLLGSKNRHRYYEHTFDQLACSNFHRDALIRFQKDVMDDTGAKHKTYSFVYKLLVLESFQVFYHDR